jgi:hypothetical protein
VSRTATHLAAMLLAMVAAFLWIGLTHLMGLSDFFQGYGAGTVMGGACIATFWIVKAREQSHGEG